MPELELWQASNERPELIVLALRQRRGATFEAIVGVGGSNRGIEFRGEEGEEEVEEVNAQRIGNYRVLGIRTQTA